MPREVNKVFCFLFLWTSLLGCFGGNANKNYLELNSQIQGKLANLGDLERTGNYQQTKRKSAKKIHKDLQEALGSEYVGISVEVDNHSGLRLGDPLVDIRCGYQSPDLGKLRSIKPGTSDVLLYNNRAYHQRGTCGSLSWQVFDDDGSPYLTDEDNIIGVRLVLTWRVHYYCNSYSNELTVNFLETGLDEDGKWKVPIQDHLYGEFHHKWADVSFLDIGQEHRVSLANLTRMQARGTVTNMGCKALLKLQILGGEKNRNKLMGKPTTKRMRGKPAGLKTKKIIPELLPEPQGFLQCGENEEVMLGPSGDWICSCVEGTERDKEGSCVSELVRRLFDLIPENVEPNQNTRMAHTGNCRRDRNGNCRKIVNLRNRFGDYEDEEDLKDLEAAIGLIEKDIETGRDKGKRKGENMFPEDVHTIKTQKPGRESRARQTAILDSMKGSTSIKEEEFKDLSHFNAQSAQHEQLSKTGNFLSTSQGSAQTIQEDVSRKMGQEYVGVALQVENFSNKLLSDPKVAVKCGYESPRLSTLLTVMPGTSDILLYNNKAYHQRGTCGSLSWQIMNADGNPYLVDEKQNIGLRLVLTWRVHYYCNSYDNEMTVQFTGTTLDKDGRWAYPIQDELYDNFHPEWSEDSFLYGRPQHRIAMTNMPNLWAKGSVAKIGCQPVLKLQLLGEGPNKLSASPRKNGGAPDVHAMISPVGLDHPSVSKARPENEEIDYNNYGEASGREPRIQNKKNIDDDEGGTIEEIADRIPGDVAVAMQIENFSGKLLDDIKVDVVCSWEGGEKERNSIEPGGDSEVLIFHNFDYNHRRTCGSVSWQIKEANGDPYLVDEDKDIGVRLMMTWFVPWKCADKKPNQVSLQFFPATVDEKGDWLIPSQEDIYYSDFTGHEFGNKNTTVDPDTKVRSKSEYLKETGISADISITAGCKAVLKLSLYEVGYSSAETEDQSPGQRPTKPGFPEEEDQPEDVKAVGFLSTMNIIYIICGFAGVLLMFAMVKCCLGLRAKNYRPESDDYGEETDEDLN